jgi:hypothetical protein
MSSASKTIKFEISLKELKVTFEGDIQTAGQIGGQVTGAFNSLVSAQQKLIGGGATPSATQPAVPAATRRRGRGRRAASSGGIDPSIIDGGTIPENGNGNGDESTAGTRPRRNTAGGQPLVIGLKDEGFFADKRTLGAIREQLRTKGHILKNSDISPALVALARNGTLKREKHANGQWIYFTD